MLIGVSGITWDDAEAACEARGGYLATITSQAECDFAYSVVSGDNGFWRVDEYGSWTGPWLGGLQPPGSPEPAGGWQWVTGENWSYTHWTSGEPNNMGGTENRLEFFGNPNKSSNWNDITNTIGLYGYVFESNTPEPATLALLAAGGLGALLRRRK